MHDAPSTAQRHLCDPNWTSRANGPCKFGSIAGQPHIVLHALFLQLCDALTIETTAVVHDVTSPALIIVSFARHGNKGTQSHCCASDSLTSRWRFFTVGVIAAAVPLFLASLLWTRRSFSSGSAPLAGSAPPSLWDVLQLRRHWPPRLVFATLQDRVVLDLCQLASPRRLRGSPRLLRARRLGDEEQDWVLRPHLALLAHFRRTLKALLQLPTSCQHRRTKGTLCREFVQSYS